MKTVQQKQKQRKPEWVQSATRAMKKQGEARKLRVTVFPREGGRPYAADVEPNEHGLFTLADKQDYRVMPGSVWEEAGILRALVNEGNPQTISAYSLTGDDRFSPTALHGVASNNLWVQLDTLARQKSPWRQASTWGILALGVILVGVLIWQVATLGGGLEEVREALEALKPSGSGAGASPDGGSGTGHQDIAPDGGS